MTSSSEEGPPPPTPGGKGGRKLDKGKLISQLSIDQRDLRVSLVLLRVNILWPIKSLYIRCLNNFIARHLATRGGSTRLRPDVI